MSLAYWMPTKTPEGLITVDKRLHHRSETQRNGWIPPANTNRQWLQPWSHLVVRSGISQPSTRPQETPPRLHECDAAAGWKRNPSAAAKGPSDDPTCCLATCKRRAAELAARSPLAGGREGVGGWGGVEFDSWIVSFSFHFWEGFLKGAGYLVSG